MKSKPKGVQPGQTAAMVEIHYTETSTGRSGWLEPAKAEALAASLRKPNSLRKIGHIVTVVHRKGTAA